MAPSKSDKLIADEDPAAAVNVSPPRPSVHCSENPPKSKAQNPCLIPPKMRVPNTPEPNSIPR